MKLTNLDVTAPGASRYSGWAGIYIKGSHHVTVTNSNLHDAGCAGIQTFSADYVTLTGNTVSGNAKDTTNRVYCSGISLHDSRNSDTGTGIKMVVANNIIFGNTNVPMPNCGSQCGTADGNGIIVDDGRRTQTDGIAYLGQTLIENNVIFGNGGKGVHMYKSDNIIVRSNTLYFNNQDPFHNYANAGEINVNNAAGVQIYGNAAYTDGIDRGRGAHSAISVQYTQSGGRPILIDANLTFNARNDATRFIFAASNAVTVTVGADNRRGDPQFRKASLDPALADFRVAATSPALRFSMPSAYFGERDILGVSRMTAAPTQTWRQIAVEGNAFSLSGIRTVRYGIGSSWVQRAIAQRGQCSNGFFGVDPAHGNRKQCDVLDAASASGTPAGAYLVTAGAYQQPF